MSILRIRFTALNESVLRINLPQLLGELSKIAQEAFAQCASYQGNPDRNLGKKPAIPISWKGIGRFVDARDGLVYRNEALIWHVRLLLEQKEHLEKEIERAFPDDTKAFQVEVTSRQKLGFILDDIIFNSMSAFDYLSEFVFAAHMPKKRGKMLWSSLIKNCHRIKDKELVKALEDSEFMLVKPLNRYRGHVIHNGPELGDVKLSGQFYSDDFGAVHNMLAPEKLISNLPIFKNYDKGLKIEACVAMFVEQCLRHQIRILIFLSRFEYEVRSDCWAPSENKI